jgi:hypothetical protein
MKRRDFTSDEMNGQGERETGQVGHHDRRTTQRCGPPNRFRSLHFFGVDREIPFERHIDRREDVAL